MSLDLINSKELCSAYIWTLNLPINNREPLLLVCECIHTFKEEYFLSQWNVSIENNLNAYMIKRVVRSQCLLLQVASILYLLFIQQTNSF